MPETPESTLYPRRVRAHRERVARAEGLWSALEAMRHAKEDLNAALTEGDLAVVLAGLPEILATGTGDEKKYRYAFIGTLQIAGIPSIARRPDVRDFIARSGRPRPCARLLATVPVEDRVSVLEEIAEYDGSIALYVWEHVRHLPGLGREGLAPLLAPDHPGAGKDAMRFAAAPLGKLPRGRSPK